MTDRPRHRSATHDPFLPVGSLQSDLTRGDGSFVFRFYEAAVRDLPQPANFGHSTSAHRSSTIVATHLLKLPSMKVSRDFGIVVRRAALAAKNVDLSTVMAEFNLTRYFDESDNLISLGPFFGGDAADECMRSLEKLGLTYIEDFFIFEGFVPEWCSFEVF